MENFKKPENISTKNGFQLSKMDLSNKEVLNIYIKTCLQRKEGELERCCYEIQKLINKHIAS